MVSKVRKEEGQDRVARRSETEKGRSKKDEEHLTLWLAGCLPCTADPDAALANPCCAMCVNKRIRIVLVTHLYTLLFFSSSLRVFQFLRFPLPFFSFSVFPFDAAFRHVPGFVYFVTFVVSSLRNFLHLFQVCCPRTFAIVASMRLYAFANF